MRQPMLYTVCFLAAIVFCLCGASAQTGPHEGWAIPPGQKRPDPYIEVTFKDLLERPEDYYGKKVKLFGYIYYAPYYLVIRQSSKLDVNGRCLSLRAKEPFFSRYELYNLRYGFVLGRFDSDFCSDAPDTICHGWCSRDGIHPDTIIPDDAMAKDDILDIIADARKEPPSYKPVSGADRQNLQRLTQKFTDIIRKKTPPQELPGLFMTELRDRVRQGLENPQSRLNHLLFTSPFALAKYLDKGLVSATQYLILAPDREARLPDPEDPVTGFICFCLDSTCDFAAFSPPVQYSVMSPFSCFAAEKEPQGTWYLANGSLLD